MCPLATNDDTIVTEYTMTTLEELGLLKMDFLGLRNITVIDDAIQEIRKTDPDFSMARVTDNDPKVMDMLTQGKTSGVFQMESSGMTGVCVGLKPQSIEDLSIIVAAYRPGPMDSIPRLIACKNDPKLVQYKHPMLEPILSVTYGCILYQEQVIEIFRKLAGYSLGQADMVRRAMSKKKVKDIEKERGAFLHGDRGARHCRLRGQRDSGQGCRGHLQRDVRLCELRLQQGAFGLLCGHRVSDGVVQVLLSEGIYGGADDVGARQLGENFGVYRRVQEHGHRAPAAGHQRIERPFYRRAERHPLRPRGHQEHRPRLHPEGHAGAGKRRPVPGS